ncbi:sensory protein TspO [Rhodobacter sphaeroides]|jgi:tryptophan-rich sensory protein|nr:TspO and MBR related proteins [Cereibacter sphaeroides 2.4.1]ABN77016.1 TspO and MBR like proteins [Cereibacter sphaeroides ATCC 17029]ACM01455.1 TspO and MBR like proteins precursor TspO [Cereibacter sphaeroides KD131]AMJ47735.1 sensory protein TspO [Cereibacter sphaeroides]EGJ21740.1 TspO and MBR like proteins precursor TspO [Cereibacter sphaeroides WS8N]SNT14250.1 TspO and MBR related proteins [[Luteovulum] sphaeroides subsp. megalophilum]
MMNMDWALFLTFLAACGAPATTGALLKPDEWYDNLNKPWWNPPRWVFPLAWTSLYFLMSLAAMRVAQLEGSGQALAFYAAQLAFNTLWTPVFFGMKRMATALAVVMVMWLFVAATMWAFFQLDTWAGVLFVPYLIWATAATGLNFEAMRLNWNRPEARA